MGAQKFKDAEAERDGVESQLDMLEQQIIQHATTPLTEQYVERCLELTNEANNQLLEINKTLHLNAASGTDMDPHKKKFSDLMTRGLQLYSQFRGVKMSFPVTSTAHPSTSASASTTSTSSTDVKLPRLELPTFSGNIQEWVAFRDMFESAVGNNTKISKSQKLTYLKSSLQGEAARHVRSLVLSDANYDIAWQSLTERYQNDRELLFSILKRLIGQPNVSSTSQSIRSLIDTTKECQRSLEVLMLPVREWSAILLYIIFQKLDSTSRELWEQSLPDSLIPNVDNLFQFLEQRARALAAGAIGSRTSTSRPEPQPHQRRVHFNMHTQSSPRCKLSCNNSHSLFKCSKFHDMSVPNRIEFAKKNRLCLNCLVEGHFVSACTNPHSCKTCNQRHHTLLHQTHTNSSAPPSTSNQPSTSTAGAPPRPPHSSHHTMDDQIAAALLATANVRITNQHGHQHNCRVMLDCGSSVSFITEACVRRIGLKSSSTATEITGLQATPVGTAKGVTSFVLQPHFQSSMSYTVTAMVMPKITTRQPTSLCDIEQWPHIKNLTLADPSFHIPSPIDILIGADLFWNMVLPQKIEGDANSPIAINSTLGWLVAGPQQTPKPAQVSTFITDVNLDNHLRRFWETESIPQEATMSTEERECEEFFANHYCRDETGRFQVPIPWKNPRPQLGSSREHALHRLHQLEKRLSIHDSNRDSEKSKQRERQREEYNKFMQQYEDLGHMTCIPEPEVTQPRNPTYYIPHHFIEKEESTSTKFRIVYDASSRTTTGISLNETMKIGPTVQDSLLDIILRFRIHPIAYTADIEKMYRQIIIPLPDADLQRILWRESPSLPVKEYRLNTVTYGTAAAPYLATKCLQQLANDEKSRFPIASEVASRDFYVDDLMSGSEDTTSAITTIDQLINLCMSGGFPLRKWTCNNQEVLNTIPEELRETKSLIPMDEDQRIKTLGVYWNPSEDKYTFKITPPPDMPGKITKRIILSQMSKIFDPLGWLSPVIIKAKILMQSLWKEHHDWDEILPPQIQEQWTSYKASLPRLEEIKIPRLVIAQNSSRVVLCGFADASESAFGCVGYACSFFDDAPPKAVLIGSKTRVAPVDATTLPRLELNAAVLLAEFLQTVIRAMKINFHEIRCYSDSTIVLAWMKSSPLRWKTYVRNRVQLIHDRIPEAAWYHVSGVNNPADCASRGISVEQLIHHPLWWTGNNEMMANTPIPIEVEDSMLDVVKKEEKKPNPTALLSVTEPDNLLHHFSSFRKLLRITSWMLRFRRNCKLKTEQQPLQYGPLTVDEVNTSHSQIIKLVQGQQFTNELKLLGQQKQLPINNHLVSLAPFIDEHGILRVGGRLKNAPISPDQRHPILLPRSHHITKIIISDTHLVNFHAGPQLVQSLINRRYWIVRGRDAIRCELKRCTICVRHKAATASQFMGQLPSARVSPASPFTKCGVDYAGPFITKPPGRSRVTFKSYFAIFVCFVTKAVHLEVVSSLSTEAFLAALRRFISRRGVPSDIFSDNGTNFVGANRMLKEMVMIFRSKQHNDRVASECLDKGIRWHFQPAGASNFGGLWEAGVKSVKHHLTRIVGKAMLTFEEMTTLIIQIEGILNSRPITPVSSDPADLSALTPAHFLIGRPMTSLPDENIEDMKLNRLQRWQVIQQQQQVFWRRWSNEFISRLQQRPKWMTPSPQLAVGQMVIIKDERIPPLKWKLGRIKATHPGDDGFVRVVTVNTAEGELKRPVTKICILPVNDEDSK